MSDDVFEIKSIAYYSYVLPGASFYSHFNA